MNLINQPKGFDQIVLPQTSNNNRCAYFENIQTTDAPT